MGVIHIENVDEKVMQSLKLRAEINGRSLEDEVRELISADADRIMTPSERAAEAARIRAMTPQDIEQVDSTEIIRELRDRGYAGR